MRRYAFYLGAALAAFIIGSVLVGVSYLRTNIDAAFVESPTDRYANSVNKSIREVEAENKGFDELLSAKNGEPVTVTEWIDPKFLCHDVTESAPNVCTTVLIGSETWKKSLVIRLATCGETGKSNCIVWKPGALCENNESCADRIRIYDHNSKFIDLVERIDKNTFISKSVKLKVTGKVSVSDGAARLSGLVEKIEFVEQP